jgi:hypothetical protein
MHGFWYSYSTTVLGVFLLALPICLFVAIYVKKNL